MKNITKIINDLNTLREQGYWDTSKEFQTMFIRNGKFIEQQKDDTLAPLLGELVDVEGILVEEGFGKCRNLNRLSVRVLIRTSEGKTFEIQHLHIYDEVVKMGRILSKSTRQFKVKGARVYRYQRKDGSFSYSVEDPSNLSLINGKANRTQH